MTLIFTAPDAVYGPGSAALPRTAPPTAMSTAATMTPPKSFTCPPRVPSREARRSPLAPHTLEQRAHRERTVSVRSRCYPSVGRCQTCGHQTVTLGATLVGNV